MAEKPALPARIAPMLCTVSEPFDDVKWHFEVKWDGVRALLFVDAAGAIRIHNRRCTRIDERYPDILAAARALPPGLVLDGEIIVVAPDGRPDFASVLAREQGRPGRDLASLARRHPACFVAFDLLYQDHVPVLDEVFATRRARIEALELGHDGGALLHAGGVVGEGRRYFAEVAARGLEGIVAKRLDARYHPGKRHDSWRKIKVTQTRACVVIGWLESTKSKHDLKSLLVATDLEDGRGLRYVGKVGSGFGDEERARLLARLEGLERAQPILPCGERGARFVAPELYVEVRFLEVTPQKRLRAPVFVRTLA